MNLLVSIFALGLLIALHEGGHFLAARRVGMKVLRYSIGFFQPIFSWTSKKTDITYQIGAVPLGGFVQVKGMNPFEDGAFEDADSYQMRPIWRRLLVVVGGPVANWLVAWVTLAVLFTVGNPEYVTEPIVGQVLVGQPAQEAGLLENDRIRAVAGERTETWEAMVLQLQAHPGEKIDLEVERGGSRFTLPVTPEDSGGIGRIGIYPATRRVTMPIHQAALAAAIKNHQVVLGTLASLGKAISGTGPELQMTGPIGIVKMARTSLESGVREFFAFFAYLSLMLFVFNLLPLPALDGGRALMLAAEAISRRRIPPKVDAVVNTVGFFLLIGALVVFSVMDIFGR